MPCQFPHSTSPLPATPGPIRRHQLPATALTRSGFGSAPAATPQVKRSTEADVANAVDTLNSFAATTAAALNFSTDKESGKTIVKVVDTATDQLIRQIPSEEAIAISHSIDKMQGLLVNQKA